MKVVGASSTLLKLHEGTSQMLFANDDLEDFAYLRNTPTIGGMPNKFKMSSNYILLHKGNATPRLIRVDGEKTRDVLLILGSIF